MTHPVEEAEGESERPGRGRVPHAVPEAADARSPHPGFRPDLGYHFFHDLPDYLRLHIDPETKEARLAGRHPWHYVPRPGVAPVRAVPGPETSKAAVIVSVLAERVHERSDLRQAGGIRSLNWHENISPFIKELKLSDSLARSGQLHDERWHEILNMIPSIIAEYDSASGLRDAEGEHGPAHPPEGSHGPTEGGGGSHSGSGEEGGKGIHFAPVINVTGGNPVANTGRGGVNIVSGEGAQGNIYQDGRGKRGRRGRRGRSGGPSGGTPIKMEPPKRKPDAVIPVPMAEDQRRRLIEIGNAAVGRANAILGTPQPRRLSGPDAARAAEGMRDALGRLLYRRPGQKALPAPESLGGEGAEAASHLRTPVKAEIIDAEYRLTPFEGKQTLLSGAQRAFPLPAPESLGGVEGTEAASHPYTPEKAEEIGAAAPILTASTPFNEHMANFIDVLRRGSVVYPNDRLRAAIGRELDTDPRMRSLLEMRASGKWAGKSHEELFKDAAQYSLFINDAYRYHKDLFKAKFGLLPLDERDKPHLRWALLRGALRHIGESRVHKIGVLGVIDKMVEDGKFLPPSSGSYRYKANGVRTWDEHSAHFNAAVDLLRPNSSRFANDSARHEAHVQLLKYVKDALKGGLR